MLDRMCFWQLLPEAWNLAKIIFRLQATCHRQILVVLTPGLVVRAKGSRPRGRGFEYCHILDGCKLAITYSMKKKIKVAKWGTQKNIIKKGSAKLFWSKVGIRDWEILWHYLQWASLNGITLGQTLTDPINEVILVSEWASTYIRYDIVIWDL
jgi:hypothetical protein